MTSTERLSLPYIVQSQSQKEVTHNDGLNLLDMMVQAVVLEVGLDTPPVSPTLGDCYVIGNAPTGDWAANAGELTQAITGGWRFVSPFEGLLVYNLSDDLGYRFDGSSWNSDTISELQNLSLLGVNASADATNKLAVASSAVLFNNIGNGIQVKLNKASAGDTASFLYQTNWSGRAEFGTTGDDDFHIKVSPDGSNWYEALVVDKDNGSALLKGYRLFIAPDSGNPTFDMHSVDGVSDPRSRVFDGNGKLRQQSFYDVSAHLNRHYSYDSAGASEGEVWRWSNLSFYINPGAADIDTVIKTTLGYAMYVNAASNSIVFNSSSLDIDTAFRVQNGYALYVNSGSNLVHFNSGNANIDVRFDTQNIDEAFKLDASTDKAEFNVPVDLYDGSKVVGTGFVDFAIESTDGTGDPTLQLLDSSTGDDWTLRQDVSDVRELEFRYNNAFKAQLQNDGQFKIAGDKVFVDGSTSKYFGWDASLNELVMYQGSSSSFNVGLYSIGSVNIGIDTNNNSTSEFFQILANGKSNNGTALFKILETGRTHINASDGGGLLRLNDTGGAGAASNPWIGFYDSAGQRQGYTGFGSSTNQDLYIVPDHGHLRLVPTAGNYIINSREAHFSEGVSFDSGSNVLEDYEEGTWTPGLFGSTTFGTPTYSIQQGSYIRIGNMVFVSFRLIWSSLGGATGGMHINGLPFNIKTGHEHRSALNIGYCHSLALPAGTVLGGFANANSDYMLLVNKNNNSFNDLTNESELTESGEIYGSMTYFVA